MPIRDISAPEWGKAAIDRREGEMREVAEMWEARVPTGTATVAPRVMYAAVAAERVQEARLDKDVMMSLTVKVMCDIRIVVCGRGAPRGASSSTRPSVQWCHWRRFTLPCRVHELPAAYGQGCGHHLAWVDTERSRFVQLDCDGTERCMGRYCVSNGP